MGEIIQAHSSRVSLFILIVAGILSIFLTETYQVSTLMFIVAFAQNVSFSLVSNARNRNNANYHIISSVLSNGVWFLTFIVLVRGDMSWSLFMPFLIGTTLGSLYGKNISEKIEERLNLTADATKGIIQKASPILLLCIALVGVVSLFVAHVYEILTTALILIGLAYIQSIGFGLSSRAKNRGSHNYLILTTIASGIMWFVTFRELVISDMSLILFVPYTVATVFGSLTGASISMKIERMFGFKPDEHVAVSFSVVSVGSLVRNWWLLLVVIFGGGIVIFLQISSYGKSLGIPLTELTLVALLYGIGVFIAESMFHTITSRASTRNHFNYHLAARLLDGTVWFMTYQYVISNGMSFELLAPVIVGRTIGGLFGQKMGMYLENKIGARMDTKILSSR